MKSDRLRRESEHLVAFQRECPFNNFSDLLAIAGHSIDERFGGTCLLQSARLREELRRTFDDTQFDLHGSHARHAEGHVVVVSRKDDVAHVLDATALATSAIPIPSSGYSEDLVRILPLHSVAKPRWLQIYGNMQQMVVTERILSGSDHTAVDAYPLRISQPLQDIDPHSPWDAKMASAPRDRLLFHIADAEGAVRTMQMHIVDEVRWAGCIGGRGVFDRPGERLDFEREVEVIARQIGVTGRELIELFDRTHTIYSQIQPNARRRKRPGEV